MDKMIYYNELYDYYKNLFTDKQQHYFEEYYFNNYSLSEIAENEQVTRNAVSKQLKTITDKLDELEEKLLLRAKKQELEKIIHRIGDEKIIKEIREIF